MRQRFFPNRARILLLSLSAAAFFLIPHSSFAATYFDTRFDFSSVSSTVPYQGFSGYYWSFVGDQSAITSFSGGDVWVDTAWFDAAGNLDCNLLDGTQNWVVRTNPDYTGYVSNTYETPLFVATSTWGSCLVYTPMPAFSEGDYIELQHPADSNTNPIAWSSSWTGGSYYDTGATSDIYYGEPTYFSMSDSEPTDPFSGGASSTYNDYGVFNYAPPEVTSEDNSYVSWFGQYASGTLLGNVATAVGTVFDPSNLSSFCSFGNIYYQIQEANNPDFSGASFPFQESLSSAATTTLNASVTLYYFNTTLTLTPGDYYAVSTYCNGGANDPTYLSNGTQVTAAYLSGGDPFYNGLAGFSDSESDLAAGFLHPTSYYAEIEENTSTLNLYEATSTTSGILKTLPADWIIKVATTTNGSGSPIVDGSGNTWFGVIDPTDGTTGWMVASHTSYQYISSYDGSAQAAMEASSSEEVTPDTSGDASLILGAIDNYYNNSSAVPSLYSSDDDTGIDSANGENTTNTISFLKTGGYDYGFPEEVIPGIITHEDGISPYDFNNLNVSSDYGHGLMQITFLPDDGIHDFDNRGIASGVTIPPCASMGDSTLYTNCYTAPSSTDGYLRFYQPYGGNVGSSTYEQYANTVQSIYANIKDGMQVLADKFSAYSYIDTSTTTASTTFSADDRRDISAIVAYNGACDSGNAYDYLGDVATDLDNITTYFPTATTSAITNLISEMHTASEDEICAQLHSPATITIQDTNGRTVGISNGNANDDFPLAVYGQDGKWAEILDAGSSSDYTFKVTGAATGTYGLDFTIKHGSQKISYSTKNVPVVSRQIDTYTIDPVAILKGQDGVTRQVDTKGNGIINKTELLSGANVITVLAPTFSPLRTISKPMPIQASSPPKIESTSTPEIRISTSSDFTSTTPYIASSSLNIISSTNQ